MYYSINRPRPATFYYLQADGMTFLISCRDSSRVLRARGEDRFTSNRAKQLALSFFDIRERKRVRREVQPRFEMFVSYVARFFFVLLFTCERRALR